MLSRRRLLLASLATAGAFTVPQITSVASAQATPSCGTTPRQLNWDTFATGSLFTSTTIAGTTISVAVTDVVNTTLLPNNQRVLDTQAGGQVPTQKHLRFEMTPVNGTFVNGSRQTVIWTFSRAVTNVSFTFFDIDNVEDAWGDRIVFPQSPDPNFRAYTFSNAAGTVVGTGTNADRFRNSQTDNNLPGSSNDGNLTITFPGPLTTFRFTYRNEVESGGQNQLISMSDINWNC